MFEYRRVGVVGVVDGVQLLDGFRFMGFHHDNCQKKCVIKYMQPLEQNHHPSCLVRKNMFIYFWHFHFKGNLQPRSARLIAVFYVSQSYIDIF